MGFVEDYMLLVENVYQFFLVPKTEAGTTRDAKIQQTITAIIEEFFAAQEVLLDYICDTKDGRQAARSRLFSGWFAKYPLRHQYTLRTMSVDFEGEAYYASVILRLFLNFDYSEYSL